MAIVGSGDYAYEPVENWAKLPPGCAFKEIGSVGVDRHDNVYVFNRGEHPMIVLDRDGNFLRSFGEGIFPRAHGVFMAPDDTVWLTDDGDHTVRQCTLDGKVLLTIGISCKPAPYMSGEPFHRCTHTAMSPIRLFDTRRVSPSVYGPTCPSRIRTSDTWHRPTRPGCPTRARALAAFAPRNSDTRRAGNSRPIAFWQLYRRRRGSPPGRKAPPR
jgi:hypothetical protein